MAAPRSIIPQEWHNLSSSKQYRERIPNLTRTVYVVQLAFQPPPQAVQKQDWDSVKVLNRRLNCLRFEPRAAQFSRFRVKISISRDLGSSWC